MSQTFMESGLGDRTDPRSSRWVVGLPWDWISNPTLPKTFDKQTLKITVPAGEIHKKIHPIDKGKSSEQNQTIMSLDATCWLTQGVYRVKRHGKILDLMP